MHQSKIKNLRNLLIEDGISATRGINSDIFDDSKILITGSTGLIGINFLMSLIQLSKLNELKLEIYAQHNSNISDTLMEVFNYPNIRFIQGDITDENFISSLPNFDFIIHSAGYAQPGRFMQDKIKTYSISTRSTDLLFKRLHHDGHFLFLSSAEIYTGLSLNCNEGQIGVSSPDHPRSCYIEGKRGGETIVNIYRENGYKASSARLALAYGPGPKIDDMRVLNQFITKGLKGDINLMDSGDAIRTYAYISDVSKILLNILVKPNHATYNVGGKSKVTIRELAELIALNLGVNVNVPKNDSYLSGAPREVGLNLDRIENEYLISNYVTLEEGLDKTIEWYKNLLS
tara:strand:- start:580 stop:1614 length:1035 start_codon:yes stop_codon:yes gene_type:complete